MTIFHNPACGTSRATLALIEAQGVQPKVVDYLQTGWTKVQLQTLLARMGLSPRDVLRTKGDLEALVTELGLTAPGASDDVILDAMVANPILVERPIVVTPRGVALCRPSERVLPLLDGNA